MNMIEKVARALSNFGNGNYQDYTDQAKAAIEAMRHPTIEMVDAACNVHPNMYGVGAILSVVYYRAAIDAALKED